MARTYAELLSEARQSAEAISVEALAEIAASDAVTVLDVRERDEWREGHVPSAVHVPRGFLEMQIGERVPDRRAPVVVYCQAGTRAAFAARTLRELGYEDVRRVDPGFARWKELGLPVEVPPSLRPDQEERYSRHLRLPEVGLEGQAKLLRGRVLLLGAGGLGSPAALYLAAAGVGTLGIVDPDVVEASNLQRQVLHGTDRLGTSKVESGRAALANLNPDVTVIPFAERLDRHSIDRIFDHGWDVVIDGLDDFATRYLVSDAGVWKRVPVVHGAISRFEGQVTTFLPGRGPCYRCLHPLPPPPELAPNCAEAGVLGVLPGVVGTLQATEAIKLLLGKGEPLVGRVLTYDALSMAFRTLRLERDPGCAVCGDAPTIVDYVDYAGFCGR